MNPEEAGVQIRNLSHDIGDTRHRVTEELFTLLDKSVQILKDTEDFKKTKLRARLEKETWEARRLLRRKTNLDIQEVFGLLKMFQDLFALYSWELYPQHDSEPLQPTDNDKQNLLRVTGLDKLNC